MSLALLFAIVVIFSLIVVGANCYTGKQTTVVKSKKYGKVTVEFSYCKSSNSVYIHIYN